METLISLLVIGTPFFLIIKKLSSTRWAVATIFSSLIVGLLFFICIAFTQYDNSINALLAYFVFSLLILSLFGTPIAIILERKNKLNWFTVLVSGFCLGAALISFIITLGIASVAHIGEKEVLSYIILACIAGTVGLISSGSYYFALIKFDNLKKIYS